MYQPCIKFRAMQMNLDLHVIDFEVYSASALEKREKENKTIQFVFAVYSYTIEQIHKQFSSIVVTLSRYVVVEKMP